MDRRRRRRKTKRREQRREYGEGKRGYLNCLPSRCPGEGGKAREGEGQKVKGVDGGRIRTYFKLQRYTDHNHEGGSRGGRRGGEKRNE